MTRDAPADGEDDPSVVLTAAEARNRRIQLRKQQYAPVRQDPNECFSEARRARDATMPDDDVTTGDAPSVAALPSTAPARIVAPPPEVLYEYMWEDSIYVSKHCFTKY